MTDSIKIAGASGFWGDAARATPQLLAVGNLDYIVYDYLAEITMSIMARARAQDPKAGYAVDFVSSAIAPNLGVIAEQGVKIISNAGGVNPLACTEALRAIIAEQGLNLRVACILGDEVMDQLEDLSHSDITEMFSGQGFPNRQSVQSVNAYLGAFPIAEALGQGADIVITGRCVDSAVTLAACLHEFGWQAAELDKLAMGSLAGHVLECGPQATGGNFTDWELVADGLHNIGYPIAEIEASGLFYCTKPEGTGGLVSRGTVGEQMLYEIGDPRAYVLPDVTCDFTEVTLTEVGNDRVRVEGARGHPAPETYKVCATYVDEFRGGTFLNFYGIDADKKARALADNIFTAARQALDQMGLPDFSETSVEVLGTESQYGEFATTSGSREVAMKIAAKHPKAAGIGVLLKEAVGLGLATPPGLASFQGGRPKPSPVVRLFSFLLAKDRLRVSIENEGAIHDCEPPQVSGEVNSSQADISLAEPEAVVTEDMIPVPLVELAWARSGDKGNKANVGVIARKPEYFPYIVAALKVADVQRRFAHFLSDQDGSVERFLLPGSFSLNFLLHDVLGGGGVASLRNDAQGKGYSQLVLEMPVPLPRELAP
jgi:hypothetical protein